MFLSWKNEFLDLMCKSFADSPWLTISVSFDILLVQSDENQQVLTMTINVLKSWSVDSQKG